MLRIHRYALLYYMLVMLRLSGIYHNRDILSLRTGRAIGHAFSPVINPNNLKIEGWWASSKDEKDTMILPAGEVRDLIAKGLVVNDHDAMTAPSDLIRMKETLDIDYELVGKSVVSENKKRIGKVQDYSVDDKSMYIQKIYVSQSLLHGINKNQIIIDRNQVVEVTDKKIIVKDPSVKVTAKKSMSTATAL